MKREAQNKCPLFLAIGCRQKDNSQNESLWQTELLRATIDGSETNYQTFRGKISLEIEWHRQSLQRNITNTLGKSFHAIPPTMYPRIRLQVTQIGDESLE